MDKLETISRASSEELAWLGGFFDGEGWISIGRCSNGYQRKDGSRSYLNYIRCAVCNTDAQCLEKFTTILTKMNVGFKVCIRKRSKKWRLCADVTIYCRKQVIKFIELVLPYLTNKRLIAIQALQYYELLQHEKHNYDFMYAMIKQARLINEWRPELLKYSRQANKPMKLKRPSETTKPTPLFYGDGIVRTV